MRQARSGIRWGVLAAALGRGVDGLRQLSGRALAGLPVAGAGADRLAADAGRVVPGAAGLGVEPPLPALSLTRKGWRMGFIAVWRVAGLCAVVSRHCSPPAVVAVSSLSLLSPLSAAVIGALALGQWLHGWALAGWLLTLGSVLACSGSVGAAARASSRASHGRNTRPARVQIRPKLTARAAPNGSWYSHTPNKELHGRADVLNQPDRGQLQPARAAGEQQRARR